LADAGAAGGLGETGGITNLLITPWTTSDDRETFGEKRRLAETFAEKVIRRSAGA
jgi:hypothetical protein